tara:strand:+ start:4526 stop:4765 length:240 start_codon:yes stop_codon:yes gene_type:complete
MMEPMDEIMGVDQQPDKMEDIGAEMEILDRKISAMDDPNDPELPDLVKARRKLSRVMRLKRLEKEKEAILAGEDEGMFF